MNKIISEIIEAILERETYVQLSYGTIQDLKIHLNKIKEVD